MRIDQTTFSLTCPTWGRYLIAAGVFIVALAVSLALLPVDAGLKYLVFCVGTIVAAVFCGTGPALVFIAMSLTVNVFAFTAPAYASHPANAEILSGPVTFVLSALAIVLLLSHYQRRVTRQTASLCDEIATRKEMAERLQTSLENIGTQQSLVLALIDNSPDGVFIADGAGRFVDVNRRGCELLGYTRAEILARCVDDVVAEDELARWHDVRARLLAGQVHLSEWRCKRKDNSEFAGEVSARLLPDGRLLGVVRDISERRRIETALEQERALFTSVLNTTDVMLAYLDRDLNFVWVNEAYAKAYKRTAQDLIGQNPFVKHPDAENEAVFRRVRDTGQPAFHKDRRFEIPGRPERGVTYWDWGLTPHKDQGGQVVGIVFSLRETTKDVRGRQALHESEQRFATMANAAPVLIWMAGPDGLSSWFNQQWLNFTGRTMAQELGNGWLEGVHPEDLARWFEVRNGGFERREPFRMDYRLRSADGGYRWVTDQAVPRHDPDGDFLGYIGACTDITERKRVEDALREHEQRLDLFIEGAPTGIAMFDRDMRFLAVSRRFLEDLRVADVDVIGRSAYEIFPAIPVHWRRNHQRGLAGETLRCAEEAFVRPDGRVRWERWEIRPWFSTSGEVGGIILFTEDITARKCADDELRAAKAEADRANNAKSRFLAAASHDLRQPLAALSLYAGTLDSKPAPASGEVLANMRACIATLSDMLSDLLDLSKLDAGVVTPNVSGFDLDAMLAKLVSTHAPEANLKGLVLRCGCFGLIGHTDPVLFQRIVGNLLANAIRYTERGGVLVGCRRRQGKAWVEVWDTGVGIPADKTAEIFEEFKQLGNHERSRRKGTGLGLAIVAKSAALLGLQVRVRSRPGKGSVFAVSLPLGEAAADVVRCESYTHRALRVALVEDNTDVALALSYCLTEFGHQVVTASSGSVLLSLLDGVPPDIVISDYRLAGPEDGFQVIAALRANFGAKLPAIVVTGDTDPRLIQNMAAQGIRLQHKPLEVDSVRAAIAELTDQ